MTLTSNTHTRDESRVKIKTKVFTDMFDIPFGRLDVRYGLVSFTGQKPYFSITGEIYSRANNRVKFPKEPEVCGCIHDEILEIFPGMKNLVDLHLSNVDGVPMYAAANGWFFFTGNVTNPYRDNSDVTPIERTAKYLRVSPLDLDGITTKEEFEARVEAFKPTWKHEADAAIEMYELWEKTS